MKFPVVVKSGAAAEPESSLYYEVAANGIFQVKKTPFYRARTRVTREVPGLEPATERLWLELPRLPAELVEEVLGFFAEVNDRFEGEAIALLFLDQERRSWRALVPPQRVPGYRDYRGRLRAYLRLDYGSVPRPEGHLPMGTIHSHADLSAYSSGVDCDDEEFGDGLHVVYGHFGKQELSRSAAFVVNGRRFSLPPERVLPSCAVPERPARADWMQQVSFVETTWWAAKRGWEPRDGEADAGPALAGAPLLGLEEEDLDAAS